MVRTVIADTLAATGAGCCVVGVLGLVVMRDAYDRLHYLAAPSLGAVLFALAIAVGEGPKLITVKAVTLAVLILVTSPALTHALARQLRSTASPEGDWRPRDEEGIEVEPS